MKKTIRLTESDLIKIIKQVIVEASIGDVARSALKTTSKSEDELISFFKVSEEAKVAKNYIKSVIDSARNSKKLESLDNLQAQMLHSFNPSKSAEKMAEAKQNMVKYLNAYAKSEGMSSWGQVRGELGDVKYSQYAPKSGQQTNQSKSSSNAGRESKPNENPPKTNTFNYFSGRRVSNRLFGGPDSFIDVNQIKWDSILNNGKRQGAKTPEEMMDYYNKIIATAIKTGDYSAVSSKGFERYGIDNFREFLKNNIEKVNEVIPQTGRWSVNFKYVD